MDRIRGWFGKRGVDTEALQSFREGNMLYRMAGTPPNVNTFIANLKANPMQAVMCAMFLRGILF